MKSQNQIIQEAYIKMFESSQHPAYVLKLAEHLHNEWRKGFDPEFAKTGKSSKERIKSNSDGTKCDINVPFKDLHPDWQKENIAAGYAAEAANKKFPNDIEKAASHVHNEWMKRNPKADYNAAQHVSYSELPEDEKEKDRVHVNKIKEFIQEISH